MKKTLLFLAMASCFVLQAQTEKISNIRQMIVSFNGANYNGLVADVQAPPDIVEKALKEKFAKQGVKPKEIDDFLVFRNVTLKSIDSAKLVDAFFKVEKKNKKEKDASTISLIPTQHGEIPDEKMKSGATPKIITVSAASEEVLSGLTPEIEMKVFEKKLLDKQEEIKVAEKKLKELREDSAGYVKKQIEIEDDLVQNKKDQESERANLDKAKDDVGATKKSVKKLDNLLDDQTKYEKKLKSVKEDREKNKTDQELGRANLERLQKDIVDLNAQRPQ